MIDLAYDPDIVDNVATTLRLRTPNRDALDTLAQSLATSEHGQLLVADLATGVGKTYVAAGLIDYLYGIGVRNVVIITPGTTIQRKTIANFTPGRPKYVPGMQSRPKVITLDTLERGEVASLLQDPDEMKLFVFTVQSLLKPNTKENRRAHRDHETLGQSLSDYLTNADDLVVIADEHHIYEGEAKKFKKSISDLDPLALIGLTATPDPSTPRDAIVYHYPLANAIADGFVKVPVLVGRQDSVKDTRTQMADAVALLNAKASALHAFCERTGEAFIQPLLFVVAQTIDEANELADALGQPDLLGSRDQVLLVTSKEPDTVLPQLDALEDQSSPFRAVVSVSMLKEGWDIKSIYVIASVRSMESELLSEQVLGRGLRLPYGRRLDNPMLDSVEVLSHHSFAKLLSEARVLLSQTLGERTDEAAAIAVNPTGAPSQDAAPTSLDGIGTPGLDEQVGIFVPTEADENQGTLFGATTGAAQVGGVSSLGARLDEAAQALAAMQVEDVPRSVGTVSIPLYIPQVTWRYERDSVSLSSLNTVEAEALGAGFAKDNAPTLIRKAVTARHTEDGVDVTFTDVSGEKIEAAVALRLPFDTIETDLVVKLFSSNAVSAEASEQAGAQAIARAFLAGAKVDPETQWRPEHASLAASALVNWVNSKQAAIPATRRPEINLVRWPEGSGRRLLRVLPKDRNLVTSSKTFERLQPYQGWSRSLYPVVAFDSWSAEFRLAELLENAAGIAAWVRVESDVPLAISYSTGAATRFYHPDFIVVDDEGTHYIVEGKRDSEMTEPTVLAKRDAAANWVSTVNASTSVSVKWAYVLSSETAIGSASDWPSLLAASSVYR